MAIILKATHIMKNEYLFQKILKCWNILQCRQHVSKYQSICLYLQLKR